MHGAGGASAEQISVILGAPGAGARAPGGSGQRRASGGSAGTWVGYDIGYCGADGERWASLPGQAGGSGPGAIDFPVAGVLQVWTLLLPDGTAQGQYFRDQCAGDPLPTPPPTADDILAGQADALPGGGVDTSPLVTGLVGLENWYWYDGPLAVQVAADLGGWTGTTTAVAREFCWDFGDGDGECATDPGSEDAPAARHTYVEQGTKQLVLTITWEAAFTLVGPGGVTVDTGLGTFADSGPPRAYDVEEREAVVIG